MTRSLFHFLYSRNKTALLRELYQGAFFVLRLVHLARGNPYIAAGRDLLPHLDGQDKEILVRILRRNEFSQEETRDLYDKLIRWSSDVLRTFRFQTQKAPCRWHGALTHHQ